MYGRFVLAVVIVASLWLSLDAPLVAQVRTPRPAPTKPAVTKPAPERPVPAKRPPTATSAARAKSATEAAPKWGQADAANASAGFPIPSAFDRIDLAASTGPLLLVGNRCYDALTGLPVGQPLEEVSPKEFFQKFAFDDDGKYVAVTGLVNSKPLLRLFSVDTGKPVWSTEVENMMGASLIGFHDDQLIVLRGKDIKGYALADGAEKWSQPCDYRSGTLDVAMDPTHTCFAIANVQQTITVFDINNGSALLKLKMPADIPPSSAVQAVGRAAPAADKPDDLLARAAAGGRDTRGGRITVQAHPVGLSFSPDGSQLAVLFSSSPAMVVIWNTKGQIVHQSPAAVADFKSTSASIAWSPDGRSLLVCGTSIYDPAAGRVVACVTPMSRVNYTGRFADNDHLLTVRPVKGGEQVESLDIPWDAVERAQAELAARKGSLLPGQSVKLTVELENARGDADKTREQMRAVLARRVEQEGLRVVDADADVTIRLRMSEAAGAVLPVYEQRGMMDIHGQYAGKSATEAKGAAVVDVLVNGRPDPVWSRGIVAANANRFRDAKIDDETVRQSMLESLADSISQLPLCYFVPDDKTLSTLPVVIGE